jgi:hypothetical protein
MRLKHDVFVFTEPAPLVVVFTKYDRLIRTKKDEIQEDEGDLAPGELDRRSREDAQEALDKCLESLKRTTKRLQTPMPRYVKVSSIKHSLYL